MAQSASLGLCESEPLEAAPGHLLQRDCGGSARVRGDGVGLDLLGQLDQGAGLTDVEGADPGAPQRGQVRTAPQGLAQVTGQGSHVGARRAGDHDIKVHDLDLALGSVRLGTR